MNNMDILGYWVHFCSSEPPELVHCFIMFSFFSTFNYWAEVLSQSSTQPPPQTKMTFTLASQQSPTQVVFRAFCPKLSSV